MKKKLKIVGLSILLLLLGISIWLNVSMIRSGSALSKLLTEKGTVILSPSLTTMLLADLQTGDKARLEEWRSYLNTTAGYDTNFNVVSTGLEETFQLYKAKEKPGRSNYFNRLVWDLRMKQESKPLSKKELLNYLGSADFISKGPRGLTLQYGYRCAGRDCMCSAVISNEMVKSVDIYVK